MSNTFDYTYLSMYNGTHNPSGVFMGDQSDAFFSRILFQKATSVFDWNLPDYWEKDYFLTALYANGYVAVLNTPKYGIIPQIATVSGFGVQRQPIWATVSSEFLQLSELKIGKDCEIIKLTPDFLGVFDIITFYAHKMALIAASYDQSLVNSRVAYVMGAKSKAGAQMLKAVIDKINKGEPAIVADSKALSDIDEPLETFTRDVKSSFIAPELELELEKMYNLFCREMGIPAPGVEKRERVTNDEISTSNAMTFSRATTFYDCLTRSIEKVKKLYPSLEISVSLKDFYTGEEGEGNENNSNRNV